MFIALLLLTAFCLTLSLTHTITLRCSGGSAAGLSSSIEVTAESEINTDVAFAASNDQLVAFALDVSQAKSVYILSTTNCTLETNSDSAPDRTLTLIANQALAWVSTQDTDYGNPFGATDVTALYISAAATGTLSIRVLYDPIV